MKPRLIILALIVILLGGTLVWFAWQRGPSIRFVGFHEGKHGRLASFQIVNDTDTSFSFYGEGLSAPHYSYKIQEPAGWKYRSLGWCGTGPGWQTLAPHSVTEIETRVPSYDVPSAPFAVGIYFERGTAAQLYARGTRSNVISSLITVLRAKIDPASHGDPDPTWSDLAQP
ncbi:MAG: hypothetical protein NTY98_18255 [Verrucomicrobia bacterium]|nr:hypothetical protein [Verrucomicrobiota bacterium]